MVKATEFGTVDRSQVGPPPSFIIGLDVTGSNDCGCPQGGQVDRLIEETVDPTTGTDNELHGRGLLLVADKAAGGTIHQHPVESSLDAGEGRGDVLSQGGIISRFLGLDTLNDVLVLSHQAV